MSASSVQSLLNARLAAFAAAQSPTLAVAYENKDFMPPLNAPYLRPHLMLATPAALALGPAAQDVVRGVYQVDVLALANKGWGPAYALGDLLRAEFARGLRLTATGGATEVRCLSVAVGPALIEDARYKLPVSVTFEVYMEAA